MNSNESQSRPVGMQTPMSPTFTATQQPSAMASSLLGSPSFSTPAGVVPVRPHHQGFGGMDSMADPMAAVYANVNQNLSPGDASLLTPWGSPHGQQVHAPESHEPLSPQTPSDISKRPIGKCTSFPSRLIIQCSRWEFSPKILQLLLTLRPKLMTMLSHKDLVVVVDWHTKTFWNWQS